MKKYYWKICYFLRVEWIFNCAYSVEECFKFSGICFLVNVINVEGSYSNSSESNFLLTFSIDFKLPRKERCWGWYARWRCEKFLFDMRSSFCVRFSLLLMVSLNQGLMPICHVPTELNKCMSLWKTSLRPNESKNFVWCLSFILWYFLLVLWSISLSLPLLFDVNRP